jgi:hypothetical protein
VNVIVIVHLPPGATLAPQLLLWAKSPVALLPVTARFAVPEFVNVTTWAVLVVPWF